MRWPPYEHVFFDCDSTLTAVEGIDVLADAVGKGWRVSVLTRAAMEGEIELEEVYEKRLRTLKPTRGQIDSLRYVYKQNVIPDAREVISFLKSQGHSVYIVSGGLYRPVVEFGLFLGVPREHIQAVGVDFDSLSGSWWRRYGEEDHSEEEYLGHTDNMLTISEGKAQIIRSLLGDKKGRSLLVGDGVSDLLAGSTVDLFVGYGGVAFRPRVAREAPVFINSKSLAPLVAVAAGPPSLRSPVKGDLNSLLKAASQYLAEGAITFNDEDLERKFELANAEPYTAVHPRPFGS